MDRAIDSSDSARLEADFDRSAADLDDGASRAMLAAGVPVHIVRDKTPPGYVIRIHPDGSEQIVTVDPDEAAAILGR